MEQDPAEVEDQGEGNADDKPEIEPEAEEPSIPLDHEFAYYPEIEEESGVLEDEPAYESTEPNGTAKEDDKDEETAKGEGVAETPEPEVVEGETSKSKRTPEKDDDETAEGQPAEKKPRTAFEPRRMITRSLSRKSLDDGKKPPCNCGGC